MEVIACQWDTPAAVESLWSFFLLNDSKLFHFSLLNQRRFHPPVPLYAETWASKSINPCLQSETHNAQEKDGCCCYFWIEDFLFLLLCCQQLSGFPALVITWECLPLAKTRTFLLSDPTSTCWAANRENLQMIVYIHDCVKYSISFICPPDFPDSYWLKYIRWLGRIFTDVKK